MTMRCGKHALNNVLANKYPEKLLTNELELAYVSMEVGEEADEHGNYDIAALYALLHFNRTIDVQMTPQYSNLKPLRKLLKPVQNVAFPLIN